MTPPSVTGPTATPTSIAADGIQTTQLNVTVTDQSGVGVVTVNLSAIGRSEAQVMEYIGENVYSTTTNASDITKPGQYCLQVNASDVVGNFNDGVCIVLNVSVDSADTNQDCVVDMMELMVQIGKWKRGEIGMMELMTSISRWKLGSGGYC